jgi:TPR repeat protein
MRKVRWAVLVALLGGAVLALAQQEETFTDITPGMDALDPDKLIAAIGQGDARAMNNLGLMWANGVGVPKADHAEAIRWWKEAARRGYPVSMNNLGLAYANGHGVKQDYTQAMKWWELAAEKGNAWAMNSIGDLYENGLGVAQDYREALDWYRRAADAGDGLAMYNLGNFYEKGLAVGQSPKAALEWYERSADKGTALAMYAAGKLIAEGNGVPADPAEAHAWFTVAGKYFGAQEKQDAEVNAKALADLTPRLDKVQLARAQEIAHNLQERIEARRKAKPIKAGPGESET